MSKRLKVGDRVHIHDRSWSASVVAGKTVYDCAIQPEQAKSTPCIVEEFGKGFPTERYSVITGRNYTKRQVSDNSVRLSVPDMPGVIIYTRRNCLKFHSREE